jgi:hypothetical protein
MGKALPTAPGTTSLTAHERVNIESESKKHEFADFV